METLRLRTSSSAQREGGRERLVEVRQVELGMKRASVWRRVEELEFIH